MSVARELDFRVPEHVPPHLVRDWDFATAPGAQEDPFKALSVLYEGPDIFWSPHPRFQGPAWVVTRHELICEVAQDPLTFSNFQQSGFSQLMGEDWDLIPLEKDGAEHSAFRTLMNPIFSPKRVAAIEANVRGVAEALIDDLAKKTGGELMTAFARPFPVSVFLSLMGLPLELAPQFLAWEDGLLHGKTQDERVQAAFAIKRYLQDVIDERRTSPTDDLVSFAIAGAVLGRPLNDEEVMGICFLLFVAGLDTVASTLGFIFKHLAENPTHQQLLRDEPDLRPAAIEEFLRAYSTTTSNRLATRDLDFHGVRIKAGDRVVLCWALSGLDDREFPAAATVDFRREHLRHTTFAVGPHRCIGSHLARRELRVAIDLMLDRIPPFRLKPGERAITHATGVFGVDHLPLVWS
ncbi:MAG: cytochrome protein [Phenylobacterium sp.]|nr:cytochrome protein [Phenylobacterium sp.]